MNAGDTSNQTQPAAELQGVGVLAGARWILRDFNLRLPAGACCAVIGPNGCGKSTLARVLEGFVWPTRGVVRVLGETFGETDLHVLRRRVKLVQPNSPVDFDPAVPARDVVISGVFGTVGLFDEPGDSDRARAEELLQRLGIGHLTGSTFGTLSTGERMRALIARAMMIPPTLLLLDEPTAGLDLVGREMLLAGLDGLMSSPNPPTILLISHHLEELPASTSWAVLMREGTVVAAGAVGSVLTEDRMRQTFGADVTVDQRDGRFTARIAAAISAQGRRLPS